MSVTDLLAEMLSADAAIGARVHQLMFLRGVTQTKLAAKLGMAQTTVSKKVRGSVGWSTDDLLAVSAALGTSIAYLFGEIDDPRPVDPHMQKSPSRGGLGLSLPDLDSNQEPPRSWLAPETLAPVAQLEVHRAAKVAAHSAVHSDHDAIVTPISFTA